MKVLRGTQQKCRVNGDEPEPLTGNCEPPVGLSEMAQKHWDLVSRQLDEAHMLANVDATALTAYCELFATWADATQRLRKDGLIIEGDRGPRRSPYFDIAERAGREMRLLLTEFGMTPASRAKVQVVEKPKPKSKWQKISNA